MASSMFKISVGLAKPLRNYRSAVAILGNKRSFSTTNVVAIWTYGIQLLGVASNSSIMCLQRAQNSILLQIANSPWLVKNDEDHEYLKVPTVKEEIAKHKKQYAQRLAAHPNPLATDLLASAGEAWQFKTYYDRSLLTISS